MILEAIIILHSIYRINLRKQCSVIHITITSKIIITICIYINFIVMIFIINIYVYNLLSYFISLFSSSQCYIITDITK